MIDGTLEMVRAQEIKDRMQKKSKAQKLIDKASPLPPKTPQAPNQPDKP